MSDLMNNQCHLLWVSTSMDLPLGAGGAGGRRESAFLLQREAETLKGGRRGR